MSSVKPTRPAGRRGAVRPPPTPRYAWLHQCLLADIGSGKYPVGSLLPTEMQIAETYGVSRHTVREATRRLVDAGLIVRQPSIGTIVRASRVAAPFVAALGSLRQLMDYTNTTRLEVLSESTGPMSSELSTQLGCDPASVWVQLETRRHLAGQQAPISFTRVYLRPEFRGIREHLVGDHPSIYSLLQQLFAVRVHTVRQDIEATLMPPEAARLVDATPHSATLHLLRCYYDRGGLLLTVSANLYVPGRFQLQTVWTVDDPAAA